MDIDRLKAQIFSSAASVDPEVFEGWRDRTPVSTAATPAGVAYVELSDKVRHATKRVCVMEVLLCPSRQEADLVVLATALSIERSEVMLSLEPMLSHIASGFERIRSRMGDPSIPERVGRFMEEESMRVSELMGGIGGTPVLSSPPVTPIRLRPQKIVRSVPRTSAGSIGEG